MAMTDKGVQDKLLFIYVKAQDKATRIHGQKSHTSHETKRACLQACNTSLSIGQGP